MGLVPFIENVRLSPFLPSLLSRYLHFLTKQHDTEDFKNFLNPGVDHMAFLKLFLSLSALQRLLSEVKVVVSLEDKAVSRYWVSVSPLCPEGSTAKGQSCSGVQRNQTVSSTKGSTKCYSMCTEKRKRPERVLYYLTHTNTSTVRHQ